MNIKDNDSMQFFKKKLNKCIYKFFLYYKESDIN